MADAAGTTATTERLFLRRISAMDAPYILELLNEPAFHKNIGDKGVRSVADARRYIADVPVAHYRAYGYGAYLVCLRDSLQPIGMCGLYQRANLDKPDLGFALSERFHGQGYAREASQAVLIHARRALGLSSLAAIVDPANEASARLLHALDFRRRGNFRLPDEDQDLDYYEIDL